MNELTELANIFDKTCPPSLYSFNQELSLEEIKMLCQNYHFGFSLIDGQNINSKSEFLSHCSVAMDFPDYFGQNWDGFEDCLTDKLLSSQTPYLIVYTGTDNFADHNPEDWEKLLDIFQSSIELLKTKNIDFYVIVN